MNDQVLYSAENFLTIRGTNRSSGRTLLQGVRSRYLYWKWSIAYDIARQCGCPPMAREGFDIISWLLLKSKWSFLPIPFQTETASYHTKLPRFVAVSRTTGRSVNGLRFAIWPLACEMPFLVFNVRWNSDFDTEIGRDMFGWQERCIQGDLMGRDHLEDNRRRWLDGSSRSGMGGRELDCSGPGYKQVACAS
jgi:hypothetical protein